MQDSETQERTTTVLLQQLFDTPDLETFIAGFDPDLEIPPFHTFLTEICKAQEEIPEQIIKRSGIERTYGHQLFNGRRKPSRDKVIQLAIGLKLSFEETQKLLQIAQKSTLYPKIKRDAAIIHCIRYHKDIYETQAALEALGLTPLSPRSYDRHLR
jgi:transcriptional regulator with XRE-family HTH domain